MFFVSSVYLLFLIKSLSEIWTAATCECVTRVSRVSSTTNVAMATIWSEVAWASINYTIKHTEHTEEWSGEMVRAMMHKCKDWDDECWMCECYGSWKSTDPSSIDWVDQRRRRFFGVDSCISIPFAPLSSSDFQLSIDRFVYCRYSLYSVCMWPQAVQSTSSRSTFYFASLLLLCCSFHSSFAFIFSAHLSLSLSFPPNLPMKRNVKERKTNK